MDFSIRNNTLKPNTLHSAHELVQILQTIVNIKSLKFKCQFTLIDSATSKFTYAKKRDNLQ